MQFSGNMRRKERVAIGQYHDQGQFQVETELDISDAENVIILLRIVQIWQ